MSKKKACKKCKMFVEGDKCINCGGQEFTTSWQGRLAISDPKKSMIANKVKHETEGEYAIKIR